MTALYLIAQEYRQAAEALADLDLDAQTIANTLEGMSGALEVKAQNVAMMARSIDAQAAAVSQWAKDATARAKALEGRAEALREYLAQNLLACGITKLEGPGVTISFRKSMAVVIDEPGLLPIEFIKKPEPPPPAPNKPLIAGALNGGMNVPGARLEIRQNIQIK